jgi:stress response protein YsnF
MRGSGTQQSQYSSAQSYSAQPSQQAQDNIVIPLYEEQLKGVGKRTVDAGQVTIRKTVTTQTVSKPIELRQESLVIDREAAGSQASSASSAESERAAAEQSVADEPAGAAPSGSGTAFQEQTFTIRLQKEEPVIQKSVVQTGKVTARKESQTAQQNVEQQIRKEDVQLDKSGANVEIRGNFEAAGKEVSEPASRCKEVGVAREANPSG